MDSYEIHGGSNKIVGNIDSIYIHGGVIYLSGNISNIHHCGGIIYDQRPSNRIKFITETISDQERKKYQQQIDDLREKLRKSESQVQELTRHQVIINPEENEDDVLVQKIARLHNELIKERKNHIKEVTDLKENIVGLKEICVELKNRLHHESLHDRREFIRETCIDALATMLCELRFKRIKDISQESGLNPNCIRWLAQKCEIKASGDARREANEYLEKQGLPHVAFDTGGQNKKSVEMTDTKGNTLAIFTSIAEAGRCTDIPCQSISDQCRGKSNKPFNGRKFRFKDNGKQQT